MSLRNSLRSFPASNRDIKKLGNSPTVFSFGAALLLWAPLLAVQGIVFERDPSFYSSIRADTSWSIGAFSFQGGSSNIQNQSLFYEPYAVAIWLCSHLGLNVGAAGFSKLVPFVMTMVAAGTAYALSKRLGAGLVGCCFASIFYVFNPWSLDTFGYFYLWTGYCLLPALILGVLRIRSGEKIPLWLPVVIAFLGGFTCWVLGVAVSIVTVATFGRENARIFARTALRLRVCFLGAGAFWILPYLFTLLSPSSGFSLTVPSSGGPLQSAHPLTDLLELRDFWWPHLNPTRYFGILPLAISALATVILVAGAVIYTALGSSRPLRSTNLSPRVILGSLMIFGLILGEGTGGITGWIYRAIRAWPLFGSSIIRSLTRSPANLALPFVSSLGIALSLLLTSANHCLKDAAPFFGKLKKQSVLAVGAFLVLAVSCIPSLTAFWNVYTPINVPTSYSQLASKIPKGTSLEIEFSPLSALNPSDGLWHYTWNKRAVNDSTLLAASIATPSLSPGTQATSDFEQMAVTNWSNATGVAKLVKVAHSLGITNLVVEKDVQLPASQRTILNRFIAALRNQGFSEKSTTTESVFVLPGTVRGPIWSNHCTVNDRFFFAGLVHIHCQLPRAGSSVASVVSPFDLPSPMINTGLEVLSTKKVVDGLGTELKIKSGGSGWVILLPNLLAISGALITLIFFVVFLVRIALAARSLRKERRVGGVQLAAASDAVSVEDS
jgi:hypothetical protein